MKQERLDRVIRNMKETGLSQTIVSAPASVFYLTGTWVHPGERMLALYINEDGATLFANRLFALAGNVDAPLVEFDDTDDSVAVLASVVKPGKLGIDKFWPSQFTGDAPKKPITVLMMPLLESNSSVNSVPTSTEEEITGMNMQPFTKRP